MNAIRLQALLGELQDCLRHVEKIENIIVFRYDEDGVPIQTYGYYHGSVNGITFIETLEEL